MRKNPHIFLVFKKSKKSFKYLFLPLLAGAVVAGLFYTTVYIFADPPSSPYTPPAPLEPGCGPTGTNCTVRAPIPYVGANSNVDLGSYNLTTTGTGTFGPIVGTSSTLTKTSGAQETLKYDSSNYATLTVASNGDLTVATTSGSTGGNITLTSAVTGDATILGSTGTLVWGGSGGTNNESLKLDFETSANTVAVTSSTGVTSIDFGSLALSTTGTLTLGGSTTGTLVTRVKAGAATESDTNGSLVVDSTNGRLYFRYGAAWHYVAQTAGFQIPDFETVDPISGEQIKEGDIVLGMINKTFEDKALHGVWVTWDSVKNQLIQDIVKAGGISANSPLALEASLKGGSETLVDRVKNSLFSLGVSFKNGVTNIKRLAVQRSETEVARIKKLELVDSETGELYCTWIKNGEWQKVKGECGSIEVAVADENLSQQAPEEIQEATQQASPQKFGSSDELKPPITPEPPTPEVPASSEPTPEVPPETESEKPVEKPTEEPVKEPAEEPESKKSKEDKPEATAAGGVPSEGGKKPEETVEPVESAPEASPALVEPVTLDIAPIIEILAPIVEALPAAIEALPQVIEALPTEFVAEGAGALAGRAMLAVGVAGDALFDVIQLAQGGFNNTSQYYLVAFYEGKNEVAKTADTLGWVWGTIEKGAVKSWAVFANRIALGATTSATFTANLASSYLEPFQTVWQFGKKEIIHYAPLIMPW